MLTHFDHTALSVFTKRNYDDSINHWIAFLKKPIEKIIKTPAKSLDALKKVPADVLVQSHHVHHKYLSAIVSYMKYHKIASLTDKEQTDIQEEWRRLMMESQEPSKEHYKDNKPSDRQEPQRLHWPEVVKVRDSLPDGIPKLLLSMYTLLEPERADYFELELLTSSQTPISPNYINLTEKKVVLTDFKTKKKYETLEQIIPPELFRQITLSLVENPRKYLFVMGDGQPFNRITFSTWANRVLKKIFGKNTTLTCVRHAFVSSEIDFTKSIRELESIGKRMGHDVMTQKRYAWLDGKNEVVEK